MATDTDTELEINRLILSDQHDPFKVLGFHVISRDPLQAVIRSFQPHAQSMRLISGAGCQDMNKTRKEGLFEIIIPEISEPFDYELEVTYYNQFTKKFHDPYSFLPQLSPFDQHLFNEGTHYNLYDKMGAHPKTINGITGTIFRVWAPSARRVSIIGNFNNWDGRVHQMRVLGASGIWELFIPGIEKGEIYKFEIRTKNRTLLEKSDPFQFFSELRPKTASIVWDLDYAWHDDQWQAEKKTTSPYDRPISIYEIHPGSWRRDPADTSRFLTMREFIEPLIEHVKEMGFTHIELMPIMEHPLDESWGYQVTGYYSTTSRFGNPQDLMYLIDRCHQENIGVILDWVPSHFPTDGHALARFDGTALYEHEDPRQGAHPDWGTLIFNYGRNEVKIFLIANALFWCDKFHIDGLRVDAVASMLYLDYGRQEGQWVPNRYGNRENIEAIEFIKHLNTIIFELFPGIMMIAEESTAFYGVTKPVHQGGLGFGFKWNMGWMNDTLEYFCKDPIYRKYHHNNLTFSLYYAFSENFILPLSHDEVVHGKRSLLGKMPGDKWQQFSNLRLLFLFLWTHPGKKLLFMGGEFGQLSEWYCKVSLNWHLPEQDEFHRNLQLYVKELNHLYRENPALWEADFNYKGFRWMDFKDVDNSIVAFARFANDPGDHVVCLLNFTPTVHHAYRLGVPDATPYKEIFCSDYTRYCGTNVCNPDRKDPLHEPVGEAPYHVKVSVPPLGGIILKPVKQVPSRSKENVGQRDPVAERRKD